MRAETQTDEQLVRYLLDDLNAEEAQLIEEAYFQSDELFERLSILEDELIDSYVSGQLSAKDRERFEAKHLSTPAHARRVEVARCLKRVASSRRVAVEFEAAPARWTWWKEVTSQSRFPVRKLQWALTVIVALAAFVITVENRRLTVEVESSRGLIRHLQQEMQKAPESRPKNENPKGFSASASIAFLELTPDSSRSLGQNRSLVPRGGATEVLVQVRDYDLSPGSTYLASLTTASGRQIWSGHTWTYHQGDELRIETMFPAYLLQPNDYVLRLDQAHANGKSVSVGAYSFHVK